MTNIHDYIKKYGKLTFDEKEFNDLDNIIFSYLTYLNFTNTSINQKECTLETIGKEYLSKNRYRSIAITGIAQKGAYKVLAEVISKERYKNIILSDYIYDANKDMQFSAITFNINKQLKCIYFEGTDELISGWKEDCYLASTFPILAHTEAIKYVNKNIKLLGPSVIIGGHSKGGNLAQVAAMYIKPIKQRKIKKIYNNDGPGLRNKEFASTEYQKIKNKLIHIVPEYSMVGVLLNNDLYTVIKSTSKNVFSHDMATWITDDDKLIPGKLSKKSKTLEKNILHWINTHSDEEIKNTTNKIFKILEDENIDDTLKLTKLKNIIKISQKFKNLDQETKKLLIELIMYTFDKYRN
jgi:hypothetical protein